MTLGILLPSRGRPENLRRFVKATYTTAKDFQILVRLDLDDPTLNEYEDVLNDCGEEVDAVFGPRVGFGASLNELAKLASNSNLEYLGMFGDDVVPVSDAWDTALVEGLGDYLGVAYGDDGLRHKHAPDLPTHYITQTETYDRLGYLAPPTIRHLFLDNVARDIGQFLDHFIYVPVAIQHHHPWVEGEHIHDQTYAEGGRNPVIRRNDQRAYLAWKRDKTWKDALSQWR